MKACTARLALAVVLASGLTLSACGPESVPDSPDEAAVSIAIAPDATGSVTIALGGRPDEASLETIAASIDGDVFAGRRATHAVTGSREFPLLEYTSTGVFDPSARPTVALDSRRLCDDLMAIGISDLVVRVSVPAVAIGSTIVPDQPSSDRTWHVTSCADAPHGSIRMQPDPDRFWRGVVLLVVVAVTNVALAVFGWRGLGVPRWTTIALSATAVAASAVAIVTHGARSGDAMEVTGTIGHGVNQMFFVACLVVVVLGPIAAILQPLYWRLPRDQRPHLRRRTATSS